MTYQRRFGLKRQELNQSASQRGEYRAAGLDSMRQLLCFLSTKAYKYILVVTQNKIRKPDNLDKIKKL